MTFAILNAKQWELPAQDLCKHTHTHVKVKGALVGRKQDAEVRERSQRVMGVSMTTILCTHVGNCQNLKTIVLQYSWDSKKRNKLSRKY